MENRKTLLDQIPPLHTVVTTTSNFHQIVDPKRMDPTIARLLKLMDGKRTINQIVRDSSAPELTILKHLAKLNQLGFLEYGESNDSNDESEYEINSSSADNYFVDQRTETSHASPKEPVEEMDGNFEYLMDEPGKPTFEFASPGDLLHEPEKSQKQNTVLVLSTDPYIQDSFFQHLHFKKAKHKNPLGENTRFGRIQQSAQTVNILGLCMDHHFNAYMDFFGPSVYTCILLINRQRVIPSYLNYLLTVMEKKLAVPVTLVLKGDKESLYHESRDLQKRIVNHENWHLLLKSHFASEDIQDIINNLS